MATLTIISRSRGRSTPDKVRGPLADLYELAVNAVLPLVPRGVGDRARYAEVGVRAAMREGRGYSLGGHENSIRVEFDAPEQGRVALADRLAETQRLVDEGVAAKW